MKTMSTVLGMTLVLTLGLSAPCAHAATGAVSATVTRVLIRAGNTFGGCMAALSVSPATRLPTCSAGWVTFDCAGILREPNIVRAYQMLEQARLAWATNKTVYVEFVDDAKANGYCLATRIDVLQ